MIEVENLAEFNLYFVKLMFIFLLFCFSQVKKAKKQVENLLSSDYTYGLVSKIVF